MDRSSANRDQAFSEIFGRRNTHHLNRQPSNPTNNNNTYDAYAASVGVELPPSLGPHSTYGYPYQSAPPNGPSSQYNRRVSYNPSVYSNHTSSNNSVHQQPMSYQPTQGHSPYPPYLSTNATPHAPPLHGAHRVPNGPRNPHEGALTGYPYQASGYASDPTVLPDGRGLTPAQAYQVQVGGDGARSGLSRPQDHPHHPAAPLPRSSPGTTAVYAFSSPNPHLHHPPIGPPPPPPPPVLHPKGPRNPQALPPRLPDFASVLGQDGFGQTSFSLSPVEDHQLGFVTPRPLPSEDTELDYLSAGPQSGEASGASSVYSQGSSRTGSIRSRHTRTPSESSTRSVSYLDSTRRPFTSLTRLDTIPNSRQSYPKPLTSPSGTIEMDGVRRQPSARDSIESFRSMPAPSSPNPARPFDTRSTSFSSTSSASRVEALSSLKHTTSRSSTHGPYTSLTSIPSTPFPFSASTPSLNPPSAGLSRPSSGSITQAARKYTKVYPAFLSRVAEAFQANIFLSERVKDGLAYNDAFTGREAVDLICEIIKTPDRNLALLLGRSLDSQKFFHDVTYDHRLRDSVNELYQFKQKALLPNSTSFPSPSYHPGSSTPPDEDGSSSIHENHHHHPTGIKPLSSLTSSSTITGFSLAYPSPHSSLAHRSASTATSSLPPASPTSTTEPPFAAEDNHLPSGVFVILSDCYSPTCSSSSLCYSSICPRRVEQAQKLNLQPQSGLPELKKQPSMESLKDADGLGGALWATSVSQAVLDSVDETERKRQEAINELIATERHFVKDLEYLRDLWIKPLRTLEIIQPSERRDPFVTQVFWNMSLILTHNAAFSDALNKRQRAQPIIETIGDILLQHIPLFQPFVEYGTHQAYGKLEFEREKSENTEFVKFVDEVERKPESRKIELNGFLTKPTTRLGRYPLLLKAILKVTDKDNPDQKWIPEAITLLEGWLKKVNAGAGKTQNRLDLAHLEQQLRGDKDLPKLRLSDENRELIHKGQLKRRGGTQSETADLDVYLLDNMILLTRTKYSNKMEKTGIYRKPIPLQLLVMATPDEQFNLSKYGIRPKSLLSRTSTGKSTASATGSKPEKEGKYGYSITLNSLGKDAYSVTLWSDSHIQRKNWLEKIDQQQAIIRERHRKLETQTLETVFTGQLRVNCAAPYDAGRRMIYGTDDGVYFSNLTEPDRPPVMVLQLMDVTQVDVLEQFQLLIVLSERSVQTFPLDSLDPKDPSAALKRGKRISSHTTFFKAGICVGKMLVCIVKSSPLSTTIKIMEPVETPVRKKQQGAAFSKLIPSRHDTLKVFKEFYIPTESSSIHFLKTRLCVGCTKGFEIVDVETLDTQGLLDPDDSNLSLVHRPHNTIPRIPKPIAIYRIESDFLLCYDDFAFYVNKNGWRVGPPKNKADKDWRMDWQGSPTNFALHYPFLLAFDPTFVEILDVNTGAFLQVIQGNNIRLLFADTPPSTVHSAAQLHQLQLQKQQRLAYGRGNPAHGAGSFSGVQGSNWRPPQIRLPPPPPVNPRSKIVFSIDDKVVEVRLAEP